MARSTTSLQACIRAIAHHSKGSLSAPAPRSLARSFASPHRPSLHEHATARSASHHQPRLALSTHSSSHKSRSSRRSVTYVGVSTLSIASILLAAYAGDPLRTDASKEPEPIKRKDKNRKIRLKELKEHGAHCPDGIWVSRGVCLSSRVCCGMDSTADFFQTDVALTTLHK